MQNNDQIKTEMYIEMKGLDNANDQSPVLHSLSLTMVQSFSVKELHSVSYTILHAFSLTTPHFFLCLMSHTCSLT